MRLAAAALASIGMGVLAGSALAQTPTVPSVSVPAPPPVPAVSVPLPVVPELPAPAVPVAAAPKPVAAAPKPVTSAAAATVSSATGAAATTSVGGSAGAGSTSAASSSPSASHTGSATAATDRPQVKHFNSSRTWIGTSGKRTRRVTTLTFVLPKAARVYFTVTKVSPECALVGRFSVHGKAGLNRIRFAGRVGKRRLDAGTYRISARTVAGRIVQKVLLVVVSGSAPTRPELTAARASDACAAAGRSTAAASTSGPSSTDGENGATFVAPKGLRGAFSPSSKPAGTPATPRSEFPTGGVLASAVEETARALRPALLILLAAAILLLAVASLPRAAVPDARLNDALARHRIEIAAVGAGALVAFAITLFLS